MINAKLDELESRLRHVPKDSKLHEILNSQRNQLRTDLEYSIKLEEKSQPKDDQTAFMKFVSNQGPIYGKRNLKKIGRIILEFVGYLRKHQIKLDDALTHPIYRQPHFMPDSKEFFLYVRSGNIELINKMVMQSRLYLFQIDFVGFD